MLREELQEQFGFDRDGAILSSGSLELDPRRLTLGLAQAARLHGVEIVSPANVTALHAAPNGVLLTLDTGLVIAADKVIAATGYESLSDIPKRKYNLISTWALATVRQPAAALWGARELVWEASDPYLYFRTTPDNRIIVGGEDAAFFNPKRRDRQTERKTRRILGKLGKLLPHARLEADYAWSGTFAESPAGLPVIGPLPDLPNCFGILGAGGNGITFSVIAADLAKAWLKGKPHPLARMFAP
jgi:glycine/D-amino acid oxidase-like deaminating enzyme